jgi:AcrR family transcriptional regulator
MLSTDNPKTTRERSLRAALDVVRSDGIQELTTRAIARRSGLTQPAIYRHFEGKDDLVREVLGEIRALFYFRLERSTIGSGAADDRLLAAMDAFRDFAIDEPRLYDALFFQTSDGAPQPPPVDPARGGNIFGFLVERVAEAAKSGHLRSEGPVSSALSLAAHAQGLVLLYRQGRFGSRERFAEFYRRSMADLLRGMT